MQKITPFLWFNGRAEEAMNFYVSVFENSKVVNVTRFGEGVITGTFEIEGQEFMVLDGGPHPETFTAATSFFISCEDQSEVDDLWAKLTADGGQEQPCGWLKDKFGVSWQVIPKSLGSFLGNPDPEKSQRAIGAMMKMTKIIVADLEAAVS